MQVEFLARFVFVTFKVYNDRMKFEKSIIAIIITI